MIENIDTSLIDWSRAQFALTAMYHWLFVPLTLGLALSKLLWRRFIIGQVMRHGKRPPNFG